VAGLEGKSGGGTPPAQLGGSAGAPRVPWTPEAVEEAQGGLAWWTEEAETDGRRTSPSMSVTTRRRLRGVARTEAEASIAPARVLRPGRQLASVGPKAVATLECVSSEVRAVDTRGTPGPQGLAFDLDCRLPRRSTVLCPPRPLGVYGVHGSRQIALANSSKSRTPCESLQAHPGARPVGRVGRRKHYL